MTSECETTLVMDALLGDLKAFDALVRQFRRAVIFVALEVIGSRDQAEDIAQEVFLLAFKALPQLQDPTKFSSWLYAITRHRAQRVSIQSRRVQPTEPSAMDRLILQRCHEISVHPADECVRRYERTYVPEVLDQLAPEFKIVLRLRYYEEWTIAQISDFLMLPVTTVNWRLHKGRQLMRQRLVQQSIEQGNKEHATKQRKSGHPPHTATAQ